MKWRYLRRYYGRVLIRRELLEAFNFVCNELKLTQQECFLMLLKLFTIVSSSFGSERIKEVSNKLKESLKSEFSNKEIAGWLGEFSVNLSVMIQKAGSLDRLTESMSKLIEEQRRVLKENDLLRTVAKELDSILEEALDRLFDCDEDSWVRLDDRRDEVKKRAKLL